MVAFTRWNSPLLISDGTMTEVNRARVLLIVRRLDPQALCVTMAVIMALSVAAGVVAGVQLGRMDLGLAICSCFAAILSCIEALLILLQ
jgi:hypothetical protein